MCSGRESVTCHQSIYLGLLYQTGRGVQQDALTALRLYLLAAEKGNPKAAVHLAQLFRGGAGLKPDHALAYMWLRVAADWGEDVQEALRNEAASLNESQTIQASQRAADWINRHRLNAESPTLTSSIADAVE